MTHREWPHGGHIPLRSKRCTRCIIPSLIYFVSSLEKYFVFYSPYLHVTSKIFQYWKKQLAVLQISLDVTSHDFHLIIFYLYSSVDNVKFKGFL
jgi:hypothetical protein